MTDRQIYREFRETLDSLTGNELAELEQTLDGDDVFRREAGPEFSRAVHNARDARVFA